MLGKRLRGCWVVVFLFFFPTRAATGRLFAVSISRPLSLWLRIRQYLKVVFPHRISCHFHTVLYMFLTSRLEVQPSQILQYCSSPEMRCGAEKYGVLIAGTSPERNYSEVFLSLTTQNTIQKELLFQVVKTTVLGVWIQGPTVHACPPLFEQ